MREECERRAVGVDCLREVRALIVFCVVSLSSGICCGWMGLVIVPLANR